MLSGNQQVAVHREQESAGQACTIDGPDHGLVHGDVPPDLRNEVRRRDGQVSLAHLLEVRPGAEGLVTRPGEDQHLGCGVGIEGPQAVEETLSSGLIQGIARLGTIDGQPGDGSLPLVAHRWVVWHVASCSRPWGLVAGSR